MNGIIVILILLLLVSSCSADFVPRLLAFRAERATFEPGQNIRLEWVFTNTGDSPALKPYKIFVHIRPAGQPDGTPPMLGADFEPLAATCWWEPNALIRESCNLGIPADCPEGDFSVFIGFYDPATGDRLLLDNPELEREPSRTLVATLHVSKTPAKADPLELNIGELASHPPLAELIRERLAGKTRVELPGQHLTASFAQRAPYPLKLTFGDLSFDGWRGFAPWAVKFRTAPDGPVQSAVDGGGLSFEPAERANSALRWQASAQSDGEEVLRFVVEASLAEDELLLRIKDVSEAPGYLLLSLQLPELASVAGPEAALVLPDFSGRLVKVEDATPGTHRLAMTPQTIWPLVITATAEGAAVVRVDSPDSELGAEIDEEKQGNRGAARAVLNYRPVTQPPAAPIRLDEELTARITLVPSEHGTLDSAWVSAAKRLRNELAATPNPLYHDAYIYKIFCTAPGEPAENATTFPEALELIRRVAQVTGGAKQVVYLVGWQYDGHDSKYPAISEVCERLGGREALLALIEDAKAYNATVSFHDNYDDAYMDSPDWDPNLVAWDWQGNLQKGGIWGGGQSYVLANAKYAAEAGLQRVQRTCALYPVEDSYHIDVLSAVPFHHDFRPEAPENASASIKGKLAIVDEFRRHGLDVTSEFLTQPFVESINHYWHLPRVGGTGLGGESIPLLSALLHGKVTWGGGNQGEDHYLANVALYGATFSADWRKQTNEWSIAETYYFCTVPWAAFSDRLISDITHEGSLWRVTYDEANYVEEDTQTGEYRVVQEGWPLIENGVCRLRQGGRALVCARQEGVVTLPPCWPEGAVLNVRHLGDGTQIPFEITTEGLRFEVDTLVPIEVIW